MTTTPYLAIITPLDPSLAPTHPIAGPPPVASQGPGFPTQPIVLPPEGQPGSPAHPIAPANPGAHPSQGLGQFFCVVPGVGVVGPIYLPPGITVTPPSPPPVAGVPPMHGQLPSAGGGPSITPPMAPGGPPPPLPGHPLPPTPPPATPRR